MSKAWECKTSIFLDKPTWYNIVNPQLTNHHWSLCLLVLWRFTHCQMATNSRKSWCFCGLSHQIPLKPPEKITNLSSSRLISPIQSTIIHHNPPESIIFLGFFMVFPRIFTISPGVHPIFPQGASARAVLGSAPMASTSLSAWKAATCRCGKLWWEKHRNIWKTYGIYIYILGNMMGISQKYDGIYIYIYSDFHKCGYPQSSSISRRDFPL